MQRHPALSATTFVFMLGLVLLYPLLLQPIVPYDEGFMLERARRVLQGEVPHRDFWSIYPAGQYHLVALAYDWLGESITSARLVDALTRLLSACAGAIAVAHVTRHALLGCITGTLMLLWLGGVGFPVFPGFSAMLLILAAANLWAIAPGARRPLPLQVGAGLLVGTAAWFRHDMAGYAMAAFLATELCLGRLSRKRGWTDLTLGLGAAALMGLTGLMWQLADVTLPTLVEQLLSQPSKVMPAYRWTPWPDLSDQRMAAVWLVPFCVLAMLTAGFTQVLRNAPMPIRRMHLIHTLTATALLAQLSVRKDVIHAAPAWLALLPALCLAVFVTWPRLRARQASGLLTVLLCGLTLMVSARPAGKTVLTAVQSLVAPPASGYLSREGLAGLSQEQRQLLSWLQKQPRDAGLYVGVHNHDQFNGNEPIWYFLSGMGSSVFLDELHPGVANLREMQMRTIQELSHRNVRFVLLTDSPCETANQSCKTPNLNLLDEYLSRHYSVRMRFSRYTILEFLK